MRIDENRRWAVKVVVYTVCAAFLCLTYPRKAVGTPEMWRGSVSSGKAAATAHTSTADPAVLSLSNWRPTAGFLASSAPSDTTELEFPEEDGGRKHLVRDIGIFLMVSAFVGYFLVKVFLEGDTEQPPPPDDGKNPPGGGLP